MGHEVHRRIEVNEFFWLSVLPESTAVPVEHVKNSIWPELAR